MNCCKLRDSIQLYMTFPFTINLVQFCSQMQTCTAKLHALLVVYFIRTTGLEVYRDHAICSMSSMITKPETCSVQPQSQRAKRFIRMCCSSHAIRLRLLN